MPSEIEVWYAERHMTTTDAANAWQVFYTSMLYSPGLNRAAWRFVRNGAPLSFENLLALRAAALEVK
jgi:hypothetical protein